MLSWNYPKNSKKCWFSIVRQRTIENRRTEIAQAAQQSISEFRSGKLKAQTAEEVISDLRLLLDTEIAPNSIIEMHR